MTRHLLTTALAAAALTLGACSDGPTGSDTSPPATFHVGSGDHADGASDEGVIPATFFSLADTLYHPGMSDSLVCALLDGTETWLVGAKSDTSTTGIFDFTISGSGPTTLAWEASSTDYLMKAVIVKGGSDDAYVYKYNAATPWLFQDSGLHAPKNVGGNFADISHFRYCYVENPGEDGLQGCSQGYWSNTRGGWPSPYTPSTTLAGAGFDFGTTYSGFADDTMMEALDYRGGRGVEGAIRNLMRQAVAALLNAADADVNYPLTESEIQTQVNAAIASGDRALILALATQLDEYNNLGCPIDNHGNVITDG